MSYYHDLITEKSWKFLQELRRNYHFVLIGGWAVYLYSKTLKSRDVDIICDYEELEKLKLKYELIKNERLKKYEFHTGEFDVDIYVPHYSNLGIPVEDLQNLTCNIEGFCALEPEALLVLKQKAFIDRAGSLKGEKDRLDIIALIKMLQTAKGFKKYNELLKKYNLDFYKENLQKILKETKSAPELRLNEHQFAKLKKQINL